MKLTDAARGRTMANTIKKYFVILTPYLYGSLNNPSKDMLVRSQAAPVHNMLSEQTLGLVDNHVRHAPNASLMGN